MGQARCIVKTAGSQSAMLDGELVILHPDSGQFFTLKDTGLAIWQLLGDRTEIESIVASLMDEYEIDAETCRAEVDRFAGQLVAAGFAELH